MANQSNPGNFKIFLHFMSFRVTEQLKCWTCNSEAPSSCPSLATTLCALSYLIAILQWRPIWGWILRTDSPLFRTSFSKAFQCSCAFFECAFQIIMQVVSLSMLALQTVCCHNFSFYFFIPVVRNALLEWALTCNTKNLCND